MAKDNQFGANDDADANNLSSCPDISNDISPDIRPEIKGTIFVVPKAQSMSGNKPNSQNLPKLIYINGRLVKDSLIAQHLRNVVPLINTPDSSQNQPVSANNIETLGYVLYFNLPLSWLNVNVHPSKQRIGIGHLSNILAHLNVALTSRLRAWQRDWQAPQPPTPSPSHTSMQVQEHAQTYHLNQADSPTPQTINAKEQGGTAHSINNSAVKTAEPISPSHPHKNPRAIMWIAKSQLQKLQPALSHHDTSTDSYLLIQDTVATSVVSLQHLYTFLNQHDLAPNSASYSIPDLVSSPVSIDPHKHSKPQELNDINQHLAQWFCNTSDNNNDHASVHQQWQHFIDAHSLVSLNHELLLPLLFESKQS